MIDQASNGLSKVFTIFLAFVLASNYFEAWIPMLCFAIGPEVSWQKWIETEGDVVDDITKRPFIAIGFSAFVLLIPLAITSTKGALKRLGSTRWRKLHRLVYLAVPLGVIHFYMRVKIDVSEPIIVAPGRRLKKVTLSYTSLRSLCRIILWKS